MQRCQGFRNLAKSWILTDYIVKTQQVVKRSYTVLCFPLHQSFWFKKSSKSHLWQYVLIQVEDYHYEMAWRTLPFDHFGSKFWSFLKLQRTYKNFLGWNSLMISQTYRKIFTGRCFGLFSKEGPLLKYPYAWIQLLAEFSSGAHLEFY